MNIINEYLVSLGFTINNPTFNQFQQTLRTAEQVVNRASSGMAKSMVTASTTMVAAIGAVTVATGGLLNSVAKADMEYQKFALRMYMTKNNAKDLKVTLDALGESIEDTAYIPELRGQFQQLLAQGRGMAPPTEYAQQMKDIRSIGFEFKRLKLEAHYATEWISYYLIKHLEEPIGNVKKALTSLNDWITKNMPKWTEKVASALASVINVGRSVVWLINGIVGGLKSLWDSFPEGVKKVTIAFAALGAIMLASPFGQFLAMLTAGLLLLEDFYGYMHGWETSETLKPFWESLLKFKEEFAGSDVFKQFVSSLKEMGPILEKISKAIVEIARVIKNELKINSVDWGEYFNHILDQHLWKLNRIMDFWKFLAELLSAISENRLEEFLKNKLIAWQTEANRTNPNSRGNGSGPFGSKRDNGAATPGFRSPTTPGDSSGNVWKRMAQRVSAKTGVPAQIIYAQWSHETGGFTHLAAPNNAAGLTQTTPNAYPQPDGANYYIAFSSPEAFADKYAWWIDEPAFKGVTTPEQFSAALRSIGYYTDDPGRYTAGIKRHMGAYDKASSEMANNSDVSFAPTATGSGYNVTQINNINATIPPNADPETYGNAIAKALQPYGGMVNVRVVHQMRELQGVGA